MLYLDPSVMNSKNILVALFLSLCFSCQNKPAQIVAKQEVVVAKPSVSFTFDDGNISDLGGFPLEEWNEMILTHLAEDSLQAVFFVTGQNKQNPKGQYLLESWNEAGHQIANHTFSHPFFNGPENTAEVFESELLQTHEIISPFSNHIKLFRFPYLKEGGNPAKVDSIRQVLAQNQYRNGYVTIDASDWYVDQRLRDRIKEVGFESAEIDKFRDFYLAHILERAEYYEGLSVELNQRHISHTLLLHHNLASALFLGDLIEKFKEKGWEIKNANEAYQDAIFTQIQDAEFAGESLIYSLAKASGRYDSLLRYPAEDSRYEKEKMNKLGL